MQALHFLLVKPCYKVKFNFIFSTLTLSLWCLYYFSESLLYNHPYFLFQGKIKYEETETFGFENTPKAFIGMLRGENTGKAVVKV